MSFPRNLNNRQHCYTGHVICALPICFLESAMISLVKKDVDLTDPSQSCLVLEINTQALSKATDKINVAHVNS